VNAVSFSDTVCWDWVAHLARVSVGML